jgi:SAM-dependent methyltransferase
MHESAYKDAENFARLFLSRKESLSIADIGSRDVNGTLRPVFDVAPWKYTGFDIEGGPNVDVILETEYVWGVSDDSYDVVVSTQVIEHVPEPWQWIREIARIVKPMGIVYICTPNTMDYHEYPVDCWRIWPDGMKALARYANLDVVTSYVNDIDTTLIARKP